MVENVGQLVNFKKCECINCVRVWNTYILQREPYGKRKVSRNCTPESITHRVASSAEIHLLYKNLINFPVSHRGNDREFNEKSLGTRPVTV